MSPRDLVPARATVVLLSPSATPRAAPPPAAAPPAAGDTLATVQPAFDEATAAAAEARKTTETFEMLATEPATAIAAHTHDDATLAHVAALKKQLEEAPVRLDAAIARVAAATKAAAGAAGTRPAPEVTKLVADAKALAHTVRVAATAARDKAAGAVTTAAKFLKDETSDVQILIASADAATLTGDLATARTNLDRAERRLRNAGARTTSLEYSYGQLYDKMSQRARNPATKRKLLLQAQAAYRRFARAGAGPRVQRARDRLAEIADELTDLGAP